MGVVKAPLILGNDLTKITPAILDVLTNKEVIAVSQDVLGIQGTRKVHDVSTDPKFISNVLFADVCQKELPSQKFSYNTTTQVLSTTYGGKACIGAFTPSWDNWMTPDKSAQLYLQTCGALVGGNLQSWLFANNTFKTAFKGNNAGVPLCVEIIQGTGEVQFAWNCTGATNQQWTINADGSIASHGMCLTVSGGREVWSAPLGDDSEAVVLFNRAAAVQNVTVKFSDVGLSGSLNVRDLWLHQNMGVYDNQYTTVVNSHGVAMLKLSKK